ncbi:HNH endonuclease family protein [Saxibacter everestensis]|uniref:HNH endonuclease family protein n=1 Tax=Saxibacter everestensis TaxID=2909229 RepID=A0ABY8QUV2_9MICO|nr:HNH endonuclease family protein [Brevibacteriaceae bacterium ZFBP1038]
MNAPAPSASTARNVKQLRRSVRRCRLILAFSLTAALGLGTAGCDVAAGWVAQPVPQTAGASSQTPTASTDKRSAQDVLGSLPVKGRAPKAGYDREEFGAAWSDVDRNGCDTRNDILKRDLENEKFKSGTHDCVILTGVLSDAYTAKTIDFTRGQRTSTAVQIDHVVALLDAWQSGALQLSAERRRVLANDPLNLQAVDGPTNGQKQASNAASWLPPNKAYRCVYVARQISVKAAYGLWVTKPEKSAMERVLDSCAGQKAFVTTVPTLPPRTPKHP